MISSNTMWELRVLVPWLYLGHCGPLKKLKAGGRPPGDLATSGSQLLRATWPPGNCARPSSWRQYPGSHLGRLHPANFVTRWSGTRGTIRDAPRHISSTRSVPRWGLPSRRLELGTHEVPGRRYPPQAYPSGHSGPSWVPCSSRDRTSPRAPGSPRALRSPPPLTASPAAAHAARSRSAPPPAAGSATVPRAAPRSTAPTRAHNARPRPEVPASASVSLRALAAELRTAKFILAVARSMPLFSIWFPLGDHGLSVLLHPFGLMLLKMWRVAQPAL